MNKLSNQTCKPCKGGIPPMDNALSQKYLKDINQKWELSSDGLSISRAFKFKNFMMALEFANKIGAIAEDQGHHPDIKFGWGYTQISLTTHAINGLSINDFIMAAKVDEITK